MSRRNKSRAGEPTGAVRTITTNRQARFHFELLDRWEAGIVLTGSEVKSCRQGAVNLAEAHVRIRSGEAWLVGCHVSPYENAGYAQHEPDRPRKLLLHAAEIRRMEKAVQLRGLALVPTRMYFSGSRVKVEVALARGKKTRDKRDAIKKREQERSARDAVDR